MVLQFGENATDVDDSIASWLRERADGGQTGRNFPVYPSIVTTIRSLHLAEIPTAGSSRRSSPHQHESTAAAVEAALATAYEGLPAEEIVDQIEGGHRYAQASAMVSGGGELPSRYLPLLLQRSTSDDPLLRRGALVALSHQGSSRAIDVLRQSARGGDENAATVAVECLAASRYVAAHDVLKTLLEEPLPVPGTELVRILSRHPRRQWSEYLVRLARGDVEPTESAVKQEAIRALGRIGHEHLTDVLAQALTEADVRDTAFHLLLRRDDPASRQLALGYALKRLEDGPPTAQMLQLFDRVRDPRVPERLIEHLDDEKADRSTLINTLARIGGAGIDRILADRFGSFKPNEQTAVLNCLTQLRSSRLISLAESALDSKNEAVFTGATRALGLSADPGSIEILSTRLDAEEDDSRITRLAKALADVGTNRAVRALESAKRGSSDEKRAIIGKQLLALRLNSPGGQHLERANRYARAGEYEKAIDHYTSALKHDAELTPAYSERAECRMALDDYEGAVTDFTSALERDPDLPQGFSNRGHCRLKLEDYEQAAADFRRGLEADPDDGQAVTGLGIALAVMGRAEEGIRIVEEAGDRFDHDEIFAYNAACVYGRAAETIPPDSPSAEQEKLRQRYAEAAVARLEQSLEWGFDDREWMRADPDLASLRDLEGFKRLLVPGRSVEDSPSADADNKQESKRPDPELQESVEP